MQVQQLKSRVFDIFEYRSEGSITRLVGIFFTTLIVVNVAEVILTTVEALSQQFEAQFLAIEIFTLGAFTVGYILRLWSCTSDERYAQPISGRFVFVLTPLVLVDLASIAPTYATLPLSPGVPINFLFIRALRLIRIFRTSSSNGTIIHLQLLSACSFVTHENS